MSGCFWEKNEMPECMKCGCRGKSFFPAELVERNRIKRAAGRLRMAEARCQALSEESINIIKAVILGKSSVYKNEPGVCPKCNKAIEYAEQNYCGDCSEDLRPYQVKCPRCHWGYHPDMDVENTKYCVKCGEAMVRRS